MNYLAGCKHLQRWVFIPAFLLTVAGAANTASSQPTAVNAALGAPADKTSLTPDQFNGRRLFEQHCDVCHIHNRGSGPNEGRGAPGPELYGELFKGQEPAYHQFIANGVPLQMPGFKYALKAEEIDAIIAYLETLPKPPPEAQGARAPSDGGGGME